MKKKKGLDYYTNRHSCFLLEYHLFSPEAMLFYDLKNIVYTQNPLLFLLQTAIERTAKKHYTVTEGR